MCTTIDFNILLPIYLGEVCFYFDFSQLFWEMSGKSWEKSYEFGRSPFFFNDRKCTKFYFDILLPTLLGEACFCFDFSQHFWEMSGKSWEKYVSSLHASPKLFWHLPTFLTPSNFNLKVRGHLRSFFLPRDNLSPCHIHLPTFLWFLVCFWLLPIFLGEVISLLQTSPNYFGRSMYVFWLLPTFLGDYTKKLGEVIISWEKSFFSQWQKVH